MLNNFQAIGYVCFDFEERTNKEGLQFVRNSITIKRDKTKEYDYFSFVAYGDTKKNMLKTLKKNDLIYIQGRLINDTFKSKAGFIRKQYTVLVDKWYLISRKNNTEVGQSNKPRSYKLNDSLGDY